MFCARSWASPRTGKLFSVNLLLDIGPQSQYGAATIAALEHAAGAVRAPIDIRVITTDSITPELIANPDAAVVVGPGSPYRAPDLVHEVVRSARERGVPLVGT